MKVAEYGFAVVVNNLELQKDFTQVPGNKGKKWAMRVQLPDSHREE